MKEIFKNVRNKLTEKYLDNNSLKNSKKFLNESLLRLNAVTLFKQYRDNNYAN